MGARLIRSGGELLVEHQLLVAGQALVKSGALEGVELLVVVH